MKIRRSAVVTAACAIALSTGISPASASVPEAAEALEAGIERGMDAGYPGIIGMVRNGDETRYLQAGVGDRGTREPADPEAKFRIGSNTKSFTAATVLLLEADGVLSLDDTVADWLPGAVDANGHDGSKITIRQLLNHTSNLPEYTMNIDGYTINPEWEPQELVDGALRNRPPNAEPGEEWEYTNTNYVLAGMVIEAATGNEPAEEMRTRIFEPLGLSDTSLPTKDNELHGNHLTGYFLVGPIFLEMTTTSVQATRTAGAIVSTLDDLADFERALVGGALLPPEQQAELKTTVPTGTGSGYGLGLLRVDTECGPAWFHNGGVPGYYSFHITGDDGERQVVEANNEFHLKRDTPGQTATTEGGFDAFCAL